jgi:membrane-bound serine protease (ClpP class)
MRKWTLFLSLLLLFLSSSVSAAGKAIVLDLTGPVSPATQDYIERGISYAENQHASLVIIQLNTPGGLDSSMRGINEAIIASSIPVLAYVYPSGARAASAGLFIMYASHLSAMTPGTNIGAASPVNLLGIKETSKSMSVEDKKVMNDTAAYIRSLAQLRGRNADWAELAVRQAASISALEAKQLNVIDEIADDYPQLLQKIDGRTVTIHGKQEKIDTKDMTLENMPQDWRYQFLAFITDPNIAYILMLIAMYGIFFELANPGMVLPGVAGVISLLLVLYAFQLMPINYAGLLLILFGVGFMIFEVYVSSFGVIGIGGIIAFIIGSIMLFDMHDANYHLSWTLIATMSIISIAFIFMMLSLAIKSHKRKIVTGQEGLIGSQGIVLSVMNEQIVVRVAGEIWEARSTKPLNSGDKIKVINVQGLTLFVEPIGKE